MAEQEQEDNKKVAEAIAELQGLIINGQLTEIHDEELLQKLNEKRVIH